jgi:hypothetical protein
MLNNEKRPGKFRHGAAKCHATLGEHFGSLMVQSINSAANAVMTGGSGSQMRVSHAVSFFRESVMERG